uniref:Dolichol kinase n=1 Tax=Trieres chinensis TaxID=1514140 RepID=A0A7S1ZLF7_TRICV|mmetsp:Transcript_28117/g.57491  ORF Transcript_28117/g.57491 Transcript_28117/m.57491 type:complete len:243 (+) Transcript_28117:58-786(+)|eukprot:CAMPEP_0183328696 /NCGR_PEP_ID=MMETSP0160_2-20130417/84412_1 /TAXON_ID=2839 ORGANISM="Odontella Sinensis, Strain Grunow 1884" /NCGR_SAMPLE_ID=MMETSP0160_2 /ASSEMBLY_ACC=CAM_ASM_000250 /LENGTH=242 /DNA_ID=CAMNT_0025496863 /DNA_START=48 /DNA_END=776 /DNA_ORIENTATION=+
MTAWFAAGFSRNALAALGTVVYIKCVIALCEQLVLRKILRPAFTRKIIHVAAACWAFWWPLFDAGADDGWSWRLNVLVPGSYALTMFAKGAILRDRSDPDVRSMCRSGDPTELLYGPIQFAIVATTVGLWLFMREESCLIMGAMGFGDGIAPVTAALAGRQRIPYKSFLGGGEKSVAGSMGMFGGTLVGYFVFAWVLGFPFLAFTSVLLASVIASLVEGLTPMDLDNVTVPIAMYYLYPLLG